VPSISVGGSPFPLVSDFGYRMARQPQVFEHTFGSGNGKITQRFYRGDGARRFLIVKSGMNESMRVALRNFWETNSGAYGAFAYLAPSDDGTTTTSYTVRFDNVPLSWQMLTDQLSSTGVTLVEIPTPSPTYSLNSTVTRFPSSGLAIALQDQVQVLVPLIQIQPLLPGYPTIYLSDRRCTIGSQLWLPRLLELPEISQTYGSESDSSTFIFGNADRVMTLLANDTPLFNAVISYSLFHVGTGIKIDIWQGEVKDWNSDAGPQFSMIASDGFRELTLPYPTRRISRMCWKKFNDGTSCPASTAGGLHLTDICDKGFDTALGCQYHGMDNYFGGIIANPQTVVTKDNSTGVMGFGRSTLTSVSLINDSIYDEVVPEVYTDVPMPVPCKICEGRDEGEFYVALGIVSEGPIGNFGSMPVAGPPPFTVFQSLDGQYWHGFGLKFTTIPESMYGLRTSYGHDPAQNNDPDAASDRFSLGQGGSGIQTYGTAKAAGTAFIEIRRTDAKGLQLSQVTQHSMQAIVTIGMSGSIWSGPGSRSTSPLNSPIWIAINMVLRARGLRFASTSVCEGLFDVASAITSAGICALPVTPLIGTATTEPQFIFRGILTDGKPLRDWLQEILGNCLGYFLFSFGKLKIGIRENAGAVAAFTVGNIIFNSLKLAPLKPSFNHLTANFADVQFQFTNNSVSVYDIDAATRLGGAFPVFQKATMNLSGSSTKSQTARIISTRLREELGGVTQAEQAAARAGSFSTTILSLDTEVGQVASLTHPEMPGGFGKFRITKWDLHKDYSIDIAWQTVTDSMYDLTFGPKPADVDAAPIPAEPEFAPADWGFDIEARGDGNVYAKNLRCATNPLTVTKFTVNVYFIDETEDSFAALGPNINSSVTTFAILNTPPVPGEWMLIGGEIMAVVSFDISTGVTVLRGQLGTTAAAHSSDASTIAAISPASNADMTVGAGLGMKPANLLVQLTGGAGSEKIASYNSATGQLITRLPISTLSVGNTVTSAPRIYRVQKATFVAALQPRFFKSANQSTFEMEMRLPMCGIVSVEGILENVAGLTSDSAFNTFTSAYPYRLRTLDNDKVNFIYPDVPVGTTLDAFESVPMPATTGFQQVYADRVTPDGAGPIDGQVAIWAPSPGGFAPTGVITITGTPAPQGVIVLVIGNMTTDRVYIPLPVFMLTTETTLAQVATNFAAWLNGTANFSQYYSAAALGATVQITDLAGAGGTLNVSSGVVTCTATGMTSQMGIQTGRKYAISFRDATDGYETDLSPFSNSTGPSAGSAYQFSGLPVCSDSRVTDLRIWALPDGLDSGTPYLVASVSNGTTTATDSITEATLTSQAAYPGPVQPSAVGAVKMTVKKDGTPWLELRIPATAAQSNIIDGVAVGAIGAGAVLTADVVNGAGAHQLRIFMQ
jgi:hypothetical protein